MLILILILLPLAGGAAAGLTGRKDGQFSRSVALCTLGGELALSLLLLTQTGTELALGGLCGIGLTFSATGLQILLAVLAASLWLVSGIADREYLHGDPKMHRYHLFLLLTEGAIMGVFFSGDLYTTLVFFEMMSFLSYPLVLHTETAEAKDAAASYLAYAVIGGLVSLMGLFLLSGLLGTLRFDKLADAVAAYEGSRSALYVAGGLSLATFAAKVCMWPLHTWLPKAHPAAPAPASALLSGIITKGGMFGVFVLSAKLFLHDAAWGQVILVFGVITMVWGGFMGLCETNLKATLAYSTMSQIGFMLTGVGMQGLLGEENALAVWGSVLHLVNHAWFKLLFFVTAGIIVHSTGKLELGDLQGFGRKKPGLLVIFLPPALGIMGVPLFNGYISKTLLHESIVEYIAILEAAGQSAGLYHSAEWLFLLSGGMTVAYMTKILVCLFVEENRDPQVQKQYDETPPAASPALLRLLTGCAALCPLLGMAPHITLEGIARFAQGFFSSSGVEETVHYFSLSNLRGGVISIAIGAALYFGFIRTVVRRRENGGVTYRNPVPASFSLEERLYRPLLTQWLPFAGAVIARTAASLFEWLTALLNKALFFRFDPIVTPKEDVKFANYDPNPKGRRGNTGTLAFGLTLFGIGYMAVMIYLLLRNFVF